MFLRCDFSNGRYTFETNLGQFLSNRLIENFITFSGFPADWLQIESPCSIFSLSWCCILTSCRILRLPCKTESNFSVISKDSKLLNHVLKTLTVTSVAQCFAECEIHKDCKSVNHAGTNSLNCQLNSKVKQEISSANFATTSPGWTYYATNYSSSNNVSAQSLAPKLCIQWLMARSE